MRNKLQWSKSGPKLSITRFYMCRCHSSLFHTQFIAFSCITRPIWIETHLFYRFWCGEYMWSSLKSVIRSNFKIMFVYVSRMPVDWKTPSGYLISFAIEFVAAYYVAISCTCNVSFPVGACCFLIAFAKDIKEELRILNDCSKNDGSCQIRFYQQFRNLIEFHSIAKRLSFISMWI